MVAVYTVHGKAYGLQYIPTGMYSYIKMFRFIVSLSNDWK
jgi:hypothetical protein